MYNAGDPAERPSAWHSSEPGHADERVPRGRKDKDKNTGLGNADGSLRGRGHEVLSGVTLGGIKSRREVFKLRAHR